MSGCDPKRNCPSRLHCGRTAWPPTGLCHRLACDILCAWRRKTEGRIALRWQTLADYIYVLELGANKIEGTKADFDAKYRGTISEWLL